MSAKPAAGAAMNLVTSGFVPAPHVPFVAAGSLPPSIAGTGGTDFDVCWRPARSG